MTVIFLGPAGSAGWKDASRRPPGARHEVYAPVPGGDCHTGRGRSRSQTVVLAEELDAATKGPPSAAKATEPMSPFRPLFLSRQASWRSVATSHATATAAPAATSCFPSRVNVSSPGAGSSSPGRVRSREPVARSTSHTVPLRSPVTASRLPSWLNAKRNTLVGVGIPAAGSPRVPIV